MASGERVKKQVPALACLEYLGQQGLRRRQGRPLLLDFQQRPHTLQFRCLVAALVGHRQLLHHGIGQGGGQRHAPTVPARHGVALAGGPAHPGRHLTDAHHLQQTAAEKKTVARLQARGKAFFHAADAGAAQILHRHACITDDGANVHAMAPRQAGVRHTPDALFIRYRTLVVRVGCQRGTPLAHKGQTPVPGLGRQPGVGRGAAHLPVQGFRDKSAAERHRHQVLHQHIKRLLGRDTRLNAPGFNRRTRGSALHHLDAVCRHQRDTRRSTRRVARAPRALQQARHAFGRADLQHALHRQKINAEVQTRGANHRPQLATFQPQFDPLAHPTVQ